MYDIEINFDDDTIDTIAKLAYDRKTGARALKALYKVWSTINYSTSTRIRKKFVLPQKMLIINIHTI